VLFGQYLIEKKKVDEETLGKALKIQMQESHQVLRESHRLLGQILYEDFAVFSNRLELNRWVTEFHEYKTLIETMYAEAKGIRHDKS
jgi:hypothetical protein